MHEGIKERAKIKFKSSGKIKYAGGCTTSVFCSKNNVPVTDIWANRRSDELLYFQRPNRMKKRRADIHLQVQESITSLKQLKDYSSSNLLSCVEMSLYRVCVATPAANVTGLFIVGLNLNLVKQGQRAFAAARCSLA